MSPVEAKLGSLAFKGLEKQVIQQTQTQTQPKTQITEKAEPSKFEAVLKEKALEETASRHVEVKTENVNNVNKEINYLEKMMEDSKETTMKMMEMYGLSTHEAPGIKAVSAEGVKFDPVSYNQGQELRSENKILDALSEVNRGQLHMESIIELATSGRSFKPNELLALQAGVYQIAQELEITSKLAENFSMNVRTLMNTNFQAA